MDAAARDAQSGLEWRVTVPEGAAVAVEYEAGVAARAWAWLVSGVAMLGAAVAGFAAKIWKIAADDPRKAVHGLKVGLALSLVSVFYYTRPLYNGVGGAAMWAIMTVVVVFEYTVGGSVYKGFNRAFATASAGVLALGVNWVASKASGELEPIILSGSMFLLAAAATFSRFIPTVKARFDYGVTIFILTFSLVALSGYRVDELTALAQQRLSTIAIGIFICLAVCVVIWPVWSGQELHLLIVRNMEKLAGAVEGCVEDYFAAAGPEKGSPAAATAKSEGYKCVLNSKASEDSHANLARWEPAHGKFGFRHPYAEYAKVGAAMRHVAYCVETLSSCARAEAQAPDHVKRLVGDVSTRLAAQCARVLREASSSVAAMTTSRALDFAVAEMNTVVHELQGDLRALPSELAKLPAEETTTSLLDAMPLFAMASLLVEISARVETVVDAVDTLATLAVFKQQGDDDHDDDEKKKETEMKVHPLNEPDSDEATHQTKTSDQA